MWKERVVLLWQCQMLCQAHTIDLSLPESQRNSVSPVTIVGVKTRQFSRFSRPVWMDGVEAAGGTTFAPQQIWPAIWDEPGKTMPTTGRYL